MPLALIFTRGDQWYLLRKPLIKRDKGDTLSLLVQTLLEPWAPCAPLPASLLLARLSELAATEPTLSFLHFFRFPPMSPPFPARRLQLFWGFLRFFVPLPPSPILFSFPLSSSPSPFPSPSPSGVRLRIPTPVPVPVPAPSPLPSPLPSCVCVCVFFPFILGVKFVECTSRGHTGGRSHRISYPPSFCGACPFFFSREGFSHSFPSSTVKSNLVYYYFLVRKKNSYRDSNSRPNVSEGYEVTSELPGRPVLLWWKYKILRAQILKYYNLSCPIHM